jgi:hypothetical protein
MPINPGSDEREKEKKLHLGTRICNIPNGAIEEKKFIPEKTGARNFEGQGKKILKFPRK